MPSTALPSTKKTELTPPRPGDASPGPGVFASAWLSWLRALDRAEFLDRLTLPARPGLLILTVVLLSAFVAALSGSRLPAPVSGFDLLTEPVAPTLDITSAGASFGPDGPEAQELPIPEPSKVVASPRLEPNVLPAVALLPDPPRVTANEVAPPVLPAVAAEPARENLFSSRQPHHGDTPMTRTWRMVRLQTLLAAALMAGPALAQNTDKATGPDTLGEIQKQLKDLQKSVDEMKRSLAALDTVQREVAALRLSTAINQDNKGSASTAVEEIKLEMTRLRTEIETLRKGMATNQTALYGPSSDSVAVPTTPARTGVVELVNTFPAAMSIVVNGRSYTVAPFERKLTEPIPAGPFSYEVLGVTPQQTRTLGANRVYAINIHP